MNGKWIGFGNSSGSAQCWGVVVDASAILGGVRCAACTLVSVGSGFRVGGVVASDTLGGIRGVGGNRAGWADVSARAISSLSVMVW